MEHRILSLNVKGLNKSVRRWQLSIWLHQQNADLIFLQETYSSPQTIKLWETEWGEGGGGGKIVESHGSSHCRGFRIIPH